MGYADLFNNGCSSQWDDIGYGRVVGGHLVRGPMLVGLTFGSPVQLAQCATNAYNALVCRHLAPPVNFVQRHFPNHLLGDFLTQFRPRYFQNLSQNLEEQWRVGKRLVKLQAIDHSKLYHSLAQDRAKSFIKREVLAKMPTKARLIQGNYNEATAYEHPDEYAAISSALKEPLQLNLGGVSFTLQYAGGLTHDELSDLFTDWWAQAGPGAVLDERDGKNWDATMQRPLLLAEIAFYEALGLLSASSALLRSRGVRGSIRLPRCSP
jgi:hypothetical protein